MEAKFKDVRHLAYQLAEQNKIEYPISSKTSLVGFYWVLSFMSRHPDLSIRKLQATSPARASAFDKVNVGKCFYLLRLCLDEKKVKKTIIFNID